uniref:Malonyl-CoA decarboxylase, mitochondrial-like n=1 Tax=Phallusia mammillata TaxID=59560 RepID=A0A6F9DLN2_9ASCI|nr:malonyl-CoA decarboxylase, mitochondrial-like [Phallusia mammillata]
MLVKFAGSVLNSCQKSKLLWRVSVVKASSQRTSFLPKFTVQLPHQHNSVCWSHFQMSTTSNSLNNLEDQCKSLIKQCIDDALSEDKNTHHNSLVSTKVIQEFCSTYSQLDNDKKCKILLYLSDDYGLHQANVLQTCELFIKTTQAKRKDATLLQVEDRLRLQLHPMYAHLFTLIGRLENGVKFLTEMRLDAISFARMECNRSNSHILRSFSNQLKTTLSFWFSVGLLQLTRVSWQTPADILEKLAKNEAVHQVRSWLDLKHRLGVDRRCYMFIHSSMPREPLVYLHVALMDHIATNITDIVDYQSRSDGNKSLQTKKNNTAIFYSITSTQKGLQGIDFGVHMIRGVVQELCKDLPNLQQFSSLSPIPQFNTWLTGQLSTAVKNKSNIFLPTEIEHITETLKVPEHEISKYLLTILEGRNWTKDKKVTEALQAPIMRLSAVYLYTIKRRNYAFDPVANFHLRNGATLWRLNWLADPSANGFQQSLGIMANYRYYLDEIDIHSRAYIIHKEISISQNVLDLISVHDTPSKL